MLVRSVPMWQEELGRWPSFDLNIFASVVGNNDRRFTVATCRDAIQLFQRLGGINQ